MKYLGSLLFVSLSLLPIQPIFAAPQDGGRSFDQRNQSESDYKPQINRDDFRKPRDQRRQDNDDPSRHHEKFYWKAGATLPEQYRSANHQIDYSNNPKLAPPTRYQQWIKVKNKYVLLNVITNTIIKVVPE
ncbi:MAG: RcnB family protein [Acinetobacter populi]|jgi:Ni/Co efflux regulator RcnB|uniref:RcnB family protein n=1 Tax=Acinetobacter populi TaxID=1582270 RepID=UPI0023546977|nr:RcnB family protein [Acinetobacter populi]MCH4248857.1 RcnB family protein [Acinetobacter populi]